MDRRPSDVSYRSELPGEAREISLLVARAFDDERVAGLVEALRASPDWIDGLSFVAERSGRLIGHALFTRSLLDAPRRLVDVLVLGPAGVAPEAQREGVGSGLIRFGLGAIVGRSEPLVFLEGDPSYYGRFGFVAAASLGFRRPSLRIPPAAFQVYTLPGYESWMTGTLVYSRVFWDLDFVGLRDDERVWGAAD
jgi:putative acetyltransferase